MKTADRINTGIIKIGCIASVLLNIFSGIFAAQPVCLHFVDSAEVTHKVILLKDIARIEAASNEISLTLGKTEVGNAAPAGFSRYINAHEVVQCALKSGNSNLNFHSSGAKRIKVRTRGISKSVADYEKQILEYLSENIGWGEECYKISIEKRQKQWYNYPGKSVVEIKGLSSPYPRGNIRLKLILTQKGKEIVIPVLCKIQVEIPVVIASESIKRNEVIDAGTVELGRVNITAFRYAPFTDISAVTGTIAVKTLSPGTIIHKRCIRPVPDVCRGDKVFIILQKGAVRLSVTARAREEGRKGDRIWVENVSSHKLIRVKIADKGIVHLNQGESI